MPSLEKGDTHDAVSAASLLGVRLVGQVMDEACTIASAAQRIGWPWTSVLSIYKDIKSGKLTVVGQDDLFEVAQCDDEIIIKEKETNPIVTTSTTQKDEAMKLKFESSIIGQGDEEFDTHQDELTTSTSMFFNILFDMSEVEKDVNNEEEIVPSAPLDTLDLTECVSNIIELLVSSTFGIISERELYETSIKATPNSPEESCYSFLADAYEDYVEKDTEICVDKDAFPKTDGGNFECGDTLSLPILSEQIVEDVNVTINEVTSFENTYLTLNRDYEQCSDEDGDPVLQDPKGLVMQDVELITKTTSNENLSSYREPEQEARKEFAAVSAVSGVSGSRKSRGSLVSRCRSQGARLLACLRGWWRRKTPGKRKEARTPGSVRGLCPLSPDARRRASSLLDQRGSDLYSTSRSVVWKFNTVNEAVVNSSRWKDYAFEVDPGEPIHL